MDSLTVRKLGRAALLGFVAAFLPAAAVIVGDGFQHADVAAAYLAVGVATSAALRAVLVVLPVNDD